MMRRTLVRPFLALCSMVVFGACATIFTGTSDSISFESEPSGAMVVIDGVDRGRTPLTTSVKRDIGGTDITYRLNGYQTRTFELGQEFNMVTILDVFCGPAFWVCGGVDLLTGAAMKYDPRTYELELTAREDLEDELDVDQILFDSEIERDALGFIIDSRIRPNVALVNSVTRQIVILR